MGAGDGIHAEGVADPAEPPVPGTKADAVAVRDELRSARRARTLVTTKDTVGEYLAGWLRASSARCRAPARDRHGRSAPLASVRLRDLSVGHLGRLDADLSAARPIQQGWFCTEVRSKVSATEAQALLGYLSIRTTERYLARKGEDTVKAAAAIDAALRSPNKLRGAGEIRPFSVGNIHTAA